MLAILGRLEPLAMGTGWWRPRRRLLLESLIYRKCIETGSFYLPTKQTSMCSFIIWNISKALERNPRLDLRHAMHSAQERLERDSREGSGMISQPPDRRYITCALLAWQQLGHNDADSLYQFVAENRGKLVYKNSKNSNLEKIENTNEAGASATPIDYIASLEKKISRDTDLSSFDTISLIGPVVKLPVEPKIVMHVEKSHHCAHQNAKKTQKSASASAPKFQNDVINKIDTACCLDTACLQRLSELDTAVNELRSRAAKLARREAERVELLERAEAAWKDLELGYQRRLNLAHEKEDDIANQIKNTVEERNNYKNACTSLVGILKEHGEIAEKEKARLTMVEKEVCERACMRLQLSEESARYDAALAEQLCRTTQLDRDLLFKEEQAQRRVWSIQNNIESARCLTHEAERAMCSELASLQDQIKQVSDQLFVEETENKNLKSELEELRREKAHIIEDLDGCKLTCDNRIQIKIEELKQKRAQLMELQERVVECKCKLPQDAAVEVRRTPSLAALCQCSPEDKVLDTYSCTSLRSQLLSSLLADLFGGLQTELNGSGLIMPCHLLKCLEDKHNWDRSSVIKTNLLNFFAQLLVGELDIAIATSIENYHAKWIAKSCADQVQTIPNNDEMDEGWQERTIEQRAQKLPSKLAEQLYNERPEQLTNKSKDIVSKGPPPCQCKSQPAPFPCVVKTPHCTTNNRKTNDKPPSYLKRTMQDVTQLRLQIENLKKDSVKKEDLFHMEDKITKIVQRVAKPHNIALASKNNKCTRDGDLHINKLDCDKCYEINNTIKKKKPQKESFNQQFRYIGRDSGKIFKKREQSFAVNLCLCETDKKSNKLSQDHRQKSLKAWKSKKTGDLLKNTPIVKQPIKFSTSKGYNMSPINKYSSNPLCPSECVCLHKLPSNTSIDKLFYDLSKWKADLMNNSKGHLEGTGNQKEQKSYYNRFPLNSTTAQSNLITSEIELNNNKSKKVMSKLPMFSVIAFSSSNNKRDKSNDHALPPTTESDCIGVIDLDKSNDNTCKCMANTYINSIHDGVGNAVPLDDLYTWHKTDFCACVKIPEKNNASNQNIHENEKSVLQNESQICSVELQEPHFHDFGCKENKRSVHDSLIYETIKKSQIFSSGDFDVKFLGVTLTNTNELFNTNKGRTLINVKSKTVLQDCFENCYENFPMKSYSSARLKCNVNVSDNRELCQNIIMDHFEQNVSANTISDVKEYEESKCICCNKNNTMIEVSNDLEVNAFNLLEEHLKGKLDELQRKCEFTCIPNQEKRELFTSIIQKVKQVISESTNPLPSSCAGLCGNETRWSRAYGLLLEYLKVKIKRVQCSCDSNDDNENPVLPKVLEKVCNLIENDFQRLKEKHIHNFKHTYVDQQISPIHQAYTEMYVQVKDSEDGIKEMKSIGDISCQVCYNVPADNKSCEVMYNDFKILNTVDKNVSCEMRNVHVTDCACRNPINMSHHLAKNFFVNLCTEPVSSKYDTITLISKNVTDDLSKSPLEMSTSLKKSVVEFKSLGEKRPEYPYVGYTLNCSCDHALGKCHCIKSMINTNYEKIDIMLKSLTNERFPKKMSYIMPIAPNVVKSEPIYINGQDGNSSLDKFKHTDQAEQDMKYCDKENSTYTYENMVLKKSKENCGIVCDEASTINNDSIDANINNEDCSRWHDGSDEQFNKDDKYKTDTVYDKHLLYDSLYVPADKRIKYKKVEHSIYFDTNLETDSENCTCKMVPICHVKMLIEDIEKKIIESKCSCDAIASRICPVHSEY